MRGRYFSSREEGIWCGGGITVVEEEGIWCGGGISVLTQLRRGRKPSLQGGGAQMHCYAFYPFYFKYHDGYGICERAALCSTRRTTGTAPVPTKADTGHAAAERTHLESTMGRGADASACNTVFQSIRGVGHTLSVCADHGAASICVHPGPDMGVGASVWSDSEGQSCDRCNPTGARGNHPRDSVLVPSR